MLRKWLLVALGNLFVAASVGALLRFAFVRELPWLDYYNFLHGHSHLAMMGWVNMALFVLLGRAFLREEEWEGRPFQSFLWLAQLSVLGMFVFFLLQGYAAGSIAFSTVHVLLAYWFGYRLWHALDGHPPTLSRRFARAALFFLALSTLALWAMPFIFLFELKGSAFYYMDVQFFLHFQFNGWFLFALLALAFRWMENQGLPLQEAWGRRFFRLLTFSALLTYALAVAWSQPYLGVFIVNSLGVTLQLGALFALIQLLRPVLGEVRNRLSPWARWLLGLAFAFLVLKMLIQAAVVVPALAKVAYTIRNYVIGFIHLMLLGTITTGLLGLSLETGLLQVGRRLSKWGIGLFLTGFFLSEALLFLQGTLFWANMGFLPAYYESLFACTLLLPTGVLFLLLGNLRWGRGGQALEKSGKTLRQVEIKGPRVSPYG